MEGGSLGGASVVFNTDPSISSITIYDKVGKEQLGR